MKSRQGTRDGRPRTRLPLSGIDRVVKVPSLLVVSTTLVTKNCTDEFGPNVGRMIGGDQPHSYTDLDHPFNWEDVPPRRRSVPRTSSSHLRRESLSSLTQPLPLRVSDSVYVSPSLSLSYYSEILFVSIIKTEILCLPVYFYINKGI